MMIAVFRFVNIYIIHVASLRRAENPFTIISIPLTLPSPINMIIINPQAI